jgi:DNA-binding transcriptional ArsR family regulator
MKYFLFINQEAIIKNQINISIEEAILLDYLFWLCASPSEDVEKQRIVENGKTYTWFDYGYFLNQMPLLRGKTAPSITTKIKKLENEGLIETILKHKRKYVRILPKADLLFRKTEEKSLRNLNDNEESLRNLNDIVKKTKRINILNNNIFLSNNKLDRNGLTTKKQFGNGEVNLILEKFKQLKGFYPTDKDPRRRAWNIVQQINTFLKKNPILIEKYGFTFEKMVDKFFNILKSKDYWAYIENLDTCRRKLNVFFGALEKKIKALETMKIVEKSLEKQNEYIENKRKEENIAEIPHIKEEIDEMRRKLAEKFKIE